MTNNLSNILENVPVSIYETTFDIKRMIVVANNSTLELLGIDCHKEIELTKFITNDCIEEYEKDFNLFTKLKKPFQLTYKIKINGKEKWIEDQIIPVLDKQGNITCLQGILTDVTIQKKAETIMFDYNEALKKGIEEKTFQLTILNKELSDTNNLKDKFFSIIAHDLRGPFSGLMKYIELILDDNENLDSEALVDVLKDIHESSESLYELMENLLTWAQIQTQSIHLKKEDIELTDLLNEITQAVALNSKVKSIKVTSSGDENLKVSADKFTLKTSIYNVITNAIKFTPRNGNIDINYTKVGKNTFIEIKDSGVGMPKEVQANIFSLTNKTSKNGTEGEKGTGLGLILTKEFVELNKGSLNIMSEVDQGTTITISFPTEEKKAS
jgi:signal transduction histidine kinase